MKFITTLRQNPKKSVAGAVLAGVLGKWIYGKYDDHLFRFAMCRNVQHFGSEAIKSFQKPKRIIVFLNPAANNSKAATLFEKNAAPILYLSGCDVSVVRSEYEGQAKQFMSVLDETDMIVAAGGDGTVNEVVTGLMRRSDFENWKNIPIGVIPLGKTNTICKMLSDSPPERQAQWISTATESLLLEKTKKMDVLKIEADNGKAVYALSDIRWGSYRDALANVSKYWYFGYLKKYMTFVFGSFKQSNQMARHVSISYKNPEPVVVQDDALSKQIAHQRATSSMLASLFNSFVWLLPWGRKEEKTAESKEVATEESDLSSLVAYDKEDLNFSTLELMISVNHHNSKEDPHMASGNVVFEEENFKRIDYIKNGPQRCDSGFHMPLHEKQSFNFSKLKLTPLENWQDTWFSIDNENYEAMPCTVEVLPNKLNMIYCPKNVL